MGSDLEYVLDTISKIILEKGDKYVYNIQRLPLYNDEPKIFAYTAKYKSCHSNNDIASGFSFNKDRALVRVLVESIERFCLDNYRGNVLFTDSSKELKIPHLNPFEIISFSESQLKKNHFRKFRYNNNSKFSWIEGFSLVTQKPILIPAQLICFHYMTIKNEPLILLPLSTGAAAGISLQDALYRAICEIVERDAFMIAYLNKIQSPRLDFTSEKNPILSQIMQIFRRYKLELVIIDLATDLDIPAFLALTIDRTGLGPAVSVGLKAGFDVRETIIGAIEESLMSRSWLRDKFLYINPDYKRKKLIKDIEDRAHFWFTIDSIKYINFWINSSNVKKAKPKDLDCSEDRLGMVIRSLKNKKMEVVYADITDKEIKKFGFVVVKVIIPKLHPLYLDERYPYLGGSRLYEAPVKMGFLKKPKGEKELNKIPHPFL